MNFFYYLFDKIKTKAGTFAAPLLPLAVPTVTAQITNDAGLCLSVDFASARKNDGVKGQFLAKGP